MKRVLILVVDGLGIGEMPDVREVQPQDIGANTLLHIAEKAILHLPNLESFGLGNLCQVPGLKAVQESARACFGKNLLAHHGADTFMGHQELIGSKPKRPKLQLLIDVKERIEQALRSKGFQVELFMSDKPILLVDKMAVVADNIEAAPGVNINVTGALDLGSYEHALEIGYAVRTAVEVVRVIVCCSNGFNLDNIAKHIKITGAGQYGVDTPGLGVYNKTYQVRHIGAGVNPSRQAPQLIKDKGLDVVLIGKAADIIVCQGARYYPVVETDGVFKYISQSLSKMEQGLIVANVQETDLAGHEQNSERWARLLKQVDREIGLLVKMMQDGDVLLVTGDHGNDPTIGHSNHTREMTPLLVYGKKVQPINLGVRKTLGDIGCTACELLGARQPEWGESFAKLLSQ